MFVSCNNQPIYHPELESHIPVKNEPVTLEFALEPKPQIAPWQEAYAAVLYDYAARSNRVNFFLHDIDRDGMPEVIVAFEYEDEIHSAVYTFGDGKAQPLEYAEGVHLYVYRIAGFSATPDNAPGIINFLIGPMIGGIPELSFGRYQRIVIDGHRLVAYVRGERYIDEESLNELFNDYGRIPFEDVEAAKEHIHFFINDNAVSEEDFYGVFGWRETRENVLSFQVTEDNIREVIFTSH
jgi:uncharacterized protein (DUF433 family)